jgi:hypothetical protein
MPRRRSGSNCAVKTRVRDWPPIFRTCVEDRQDREDQTGVWDRGSIVFRKGIGGIKSTVLFTCRSSVVILTTHNRRAEDSLHSSLQGLLDPLCLAWSRCVSVARHTEAHGAQVGGGAVNPLGTLCLATDTRLDQARHTLPRRPRNAVTYGRCFRSRGKWPPLTATLS